MIEIERVKSECWKLLVLLEAPEPGLGTWQEAVNALRISIAGRDGLAKENARLRGALRVVACSSLVYGGIPEIEDIGRIAKAALADGDS